MADSILNKERRIMNKICKWSMKCVENDTCEPMFFRIIFYPIRLLLLLIIMLFMGIGWIIGFRECDRCGNIIHPLQKFKKLDFGGDWTPIGMVNGGNIILCLKCYERSK